jgi:hypothetical protein
LPLLKKLKKSPAAPLYLNADYFKLPKQDFSIAFSLKKKNFKASEEIRI